MPGAAGQPGAARHAHDSLLICRAPDFAQQDFVQCAIAQESRHAVC